MTSNLVTYSNVCDCFYDFFVYLIDTVRDPWWGWLGQACKTKCIGCSGEYSYTVVQLMSTPLLWYSTGNVAFPACSRRAFGGASSQLPFIAGTTQVTGFKNPSTRVCYFQR